MIRSTSDLCAFEIASKYNNRSAFGTKSNIEDKTFVQKTSVNYFHKKGSIADVRLVLNTPLNKGKNLLLWRPSMKTHTN